MFLFVAHKTKPDGLKATIANHNSTGEYIILTDDQFNVFAAELSIAEVRHSTLINKKGVIILKNAP